MKQQDVSPIAASRRNFLTGAATAGVGLASAIVIGSKFTTNEQKVAAASAQYSDVDILNFALNLEYLEAEFYAMVTWGANLVGLGVITAAEETGPTTGGYMVKNFGNSPLATFASALRYDEINHVKYLRAALGSAAVKKPIRGCWGKRLPRSCAADQQQHVSRCSGCYSGDRGPTRGVASNGLHHEWR